MLQASLVCTIRLSGGVEIVLNLLLSTLCGLSRQMVGEKSEEKHFLNWNIRA